MAEKDKKVEYIPTPPVGWTVQWFNAGQRSNGATAAIVTQVEGVGRVKLAAIPPRSEPVFKEGVRHITQAERELRATNTVRNGAWDFIPGHVPPDPGKVHREEIEAQQLEEMRREDAKKVPANA